MRADRLISILMLLQARGRMTAQALAAELEVSERTIYRDIDALSTSGVPVYCEAGPGGGIGLLDSYRTSLTGLTDSEVRALFSVSVPDALNVGDDLRAALRKVAAALPAARHETGNLESDLYVDATWWGQGEEPVPYLPLLHQAVRERCSLVMRYRRYSGLEVESTVDPLGLVAKGGVWYLVYDRAGRRWVQRVTDILDARMSGSHFDRPEGFDLRTFWQTWARSTDAQRNAYEATVRVAPGAQAVLPRFFGNAVRLRIDAAERDEQGWMILTLGFESLEAARDRLLALGGAVEVLAPEPLRQSVLDYAQQIAARYGV